MAYPIALDGRPEVPSRGELWSMLLGALFVSAILAAAFRVASFASAPLADDELAYRPPQPVMRAADPRGPRPVVVVGPERRVAVRRLRQPSVAPVPDVDP